MPTSLWDLGEWAGYPGNELEVLYITCPFCEERGNFSVEHHAEKKKPNGTKVLNFDTLKCGSCAGYVMAVWSAASDLSRNHDYRVLPGSTSLKRFPKHWPEEVGRYWLQAHKNMRDQNWDAAILLARSALQVALRDQKATGANLKLEIDDLATKGALPPLMKEWSHNIRDLGNDSAHPKPGQAAPSGKDAQDIVQFLDFLLEYLYDLPERIKRFRERKGEIR